MTDWALIREVLNAAVDTCEAVDRLGLGEEDRDLPAGSGGVRVWEVMMSAWTYPENLRYALIRARHRLGLDAPYRPEFARVLEQVAGVCAELVGADQLDTALPDPEGGTADPPIRSQVQQMVRWYPDCMVPLLSQAAAQRGPAPPLGTRQNARAAE